MDKTTIETQVYSILCNVLKHSNFTMHDELVAADVDGWDSLTHMIIIAEIEKNFSVRFSLKEVNKLKNMGDLKNLISSKI